MEENIDAAQVYLVVRNQLIFGPRGPVDINQLAVHEAMKLYRIQNRRECFEKVIMLASHFLEKMRMETEGQ